jgi:hypothetical protein
VLLLLNQGRSVTALLEVAPLLLEAIELAVETGLPQGGAVPASRLTWRSVDTSLGPKREGAIRVEEQTRSRMVGGKKWTPKNGRFRVCRSAQGRGRSSPTSGGARTRPARIR